MLLVLALLIPLVLGSLWLFARVQPQGMSVSSSRRFNYWVGALAVASVIAVVVYFWRATGHSGDSAWWPVLALLGSLFLLAVLLGAATVVRFFVFRRPPNL